MTDPHDDPILAVLDELRALRQAVQQGIAGARDATDSVTDMQADITRIEAKSNDRARVFRRLWVGLAAFMIVVATYITYAERQGADDRGCFQQYSNAAAQRSERISRASDVRIGTLNEVIRIRTTTDHGPQLQAALAAAATAGENYERVARQNPPIPARTVNCT